MISFKHSIKLSGKDLEAIDVISAEYIKDNIPWFLGYSGGKDSTAVIKLVFSALLRMSEFHKDVSIFYCDTGVENPIVTKYVYDTFERLSNEARLLKIPIKFKLVKPVITDSFFVCVIGRGYPPPTNIFRWCTDRLRINPVKQIINEHENATIILGIREGESEQRDRTISKHNTKDKYYLKQGNSNGRKIFSPILKHDLEDVWNTIRYNKYPQSIDYNQIRAIYLDAEAECPMYREIKGSPCGGSRFGCWTCTVVRQDKSTTNMIENGYTELKELLDFRNWLQEFRNLSKYRCCSRRNGHKGLGPITIAGRKIILKKLLEAQSNSGIKLISEQEIDVIKDLWRSDLNDDLYFDK